MRRLVIAICIVLCAITTIMADSLCDQSIDEGIKLYSKGQYNDALTYFEYANNRCPDSKASNWILKCKSAISNNSKQSAIKPNYTYVLKTTPIQEPIKLSVNTQNVYFNKYGGTVPIQVTCNKKWGFTYIWKDASHQSKSYDFEVKLEGNTLFVHSNANPYEYTRSAQFDVFVRENTKIRYTVYITQEAGNGYYIKTISNSTNFQSTGGVITLSVQSNSDWYVESKSNWLGYRNKTNNSIEIFCNMNNTTSDLYGSVVLKTINGGKTATINFKQNKKWSSASYSNTEYMSASDSFMEYNGWCSIKWAQVGIGYGYPVNFDISALDFRIAWFEISLLNFGWQSNFYSDNYYWQPNVKFHIPLDRDWTMAISAGPKLNLDNYYYDLPSDWLCMSKRWWFNAQFGFNWEWSESFGSEFYIRYNGCIAIGATIDFHTSY